VGVRFTGDGAEHRHGRGHVEVLAFRAFGLGHVPRGLIELVVDLGADG
jgi:hypothetical protein